MCRCCFDRTSYHMNYFCLPLLHLVLRSICVSGPLSLGFNRFVLNPSLKTCQKWSAGDRVSFRRWGSWWSGGRGEKPSFRRTFGKSTSSTKMAVMSRNSNGIAPGSSIAYVRSSLNPFVICTTYFCVAVFDVYLCLCAHSQALLCCSKSVWRTLAPKSCVANPSPRQSGAPSLSRQSSFKNGLRATFASLRRKRWTWRKNYTKRVWLVTRGRKRTTLRKAPI